MGSSEWLKSACVGDTGRSFDRDGGHRHGCHTELGWGPGWSRSCITKVSKNPNQVKLTGTTHPPEEHRALLWSDAGTEGWVPLSSWHHAQGRALSTCVS